MNTINNFMLSVVAGLLNCYIEEKQYSEGSVEVVNDGLKLVNNVTKQYAEGWLYNYDEDYEVIKNKIKKFLDWNNQ